MLEVITDTVIIDFDDIEQSITIIDFLKLLAAESGEFIVTEDGINKINLTRIWQTK